MPGPPKKEPGGVDRMVHLRVTTELLERLRSTASKAGRGIGVADIARGVLRETYKRGLVDELLASGKHPSEWGR